MPESYQLQTEGKTYHKKYVKSNKFYSIINYEHKVRNAID